MKSTCLAAAALALRTPPAFAATVTTAAVADVTVRDTNNDGVVDDALPLDDVHLRVFGAGSVGRGVLEYDLSGIGASEAVDSASVNFSPAERVCRASCTFTVMPAMASQQSRTATLCRRVSGRFRW